MAETLKGNVIQDVPMKAVSEASRAQWWEWVVVGVVFAMAVICAHIA